MIRQSYCVRARGEQGASTERKTAFLVLSGEEREIAHRCWVYWSSEEPSNMPLAEGRS